MGQPHLAADDAVVADAGAAAEDGRTGIDGDVVLEVGMALVALAALEVAFAVLGGGVPGAEGDALVEHAMGADGAGFADHHPGAVVDEERGADGRPRMDVDA